MALPLLDYHTSNREREKQHIYKTFLLKFINRFAQVCSFTFFLTFFASIVFEQNALSLRVLTVVRRELL